MSFTPQNLLAQAQKIGKSIQDFAEDKAAEIGNAIETAANINPNAVADSVASSVSQIPAGAVEPSLNMPLDYRDIQQYNNAELERFNRILGITGGKKTPFPNELRDFASYNYVLGLGVLSPREVNFPDETYRIREPSIMILKSGGGLGDKKSTTIYEGNGKLEYYMDELDVQSIISMGGKNKQTNATGIDFKITEPYSMGLFLQSLQVAAMQAGYKNYLEAPYIIVIEFKGWDINGNQINKPMLRRLLPIKLVNIDFQVTEGGSSYECKALPFNEQGLADQIQSVKTDVNLTGSTVQELLQSGGFSLAGYINQYQQKRREENQTIQPDEYIISFPTERSSAKEKLAGNLADAGSATTDQSLNPGEERELSNEEKIEIYQSITGNEDSNIPADFDADLSKLLGVIVTKSDIGEAVRQKVEDPEFTNEIGKAKLVQSYLDGGKQPFGRPRFVEETKDADERPQFVNTVGTGVFKRGNITIKNNGRTLSFKSGTPVQDIIEEIIILSEYGSKISDEVPDTNGMIPWFRIETDVYIIQNKEQMDLTGEYPKLFVYRVMPYKAHVNRILPTTKSSPGIQEIERQICKEYDYIYTGKNDDVLNFNINFDVAFFTAITPFQGKYKLGEKDSKSDSSGDATETEDKQVAKGDSNNNSSSGNATTRETTSTESGGKGGGFPERTKTTIARDFNDALVNSNVDLISANMEIWGDPYYISDSGFGNYNADETPIINLTEDGTMDYQSSEVDIKVNFRTPLDYNSDGNMDFPGLGTKPVGAFSGIYQVLFVNHKFTGGTFTQDLRLIRRRNQPGQDTKVEATSSGVKVVEDRVEDQAPEE